MTPRERRERRDRAGRRERLCTPQPLLQLRTRCEAHNLIRSHARAQ
jgi:hypothetical protein